MNKFNNPNLDTATKSHVSEAAEELLKEGKKYANEVYQQGVEKVSEVENLVKEYSDQVAKKIYEKPVTSVMVAAGIGFLLASFLRK